MVKRDSLYGRNIYRVDTRLQEAHKIGERFRAVVAVEGFNLFNHSNYGTYNGSQTIRSTALRGHNLICDRHSRRMAATFTAISSDASSSNLS